MKMKEFLTENHATKV